MTLKHKNLSWLRIGEKTTGTNSPTNGSIGNLNRPLLELLENDEYLMQQIDALNSDVAVHNHDDLYWRKIELGSNIAGEKVHINQIFPKNESKNLVMFDLPVGGHIGGGGTLSGIITSI